LRAFLDHIDEPSRKTPNDTELRILAAAVAVLERVASTILPAAFPIISPDFALDEKIDRFVTRTSSSLRGGRTSPAMFSAGWCIIPTASSPF
jgi:hypothetical protein